MVTEPAATPLTNPEELFTVAVFVLDEDQVPPLTIFESWSVAPARTVLLPVISGK